MGRYPRAQRGLTTPSDAGTYDDRRKTILHRALRGDGGSWIGRRGRENR